MECRHQWNMQPLREWKRVHALNAEMGVDKRGAAALQQTFVRGRVTRQHLLSNAQICARPLIAQSQRVRARRRLTVTHPTQIERLVAAQILCLLDNERLGY